MKLTRLRIRRLPGIDRPYTLEDLDGGLNYVGGPNGSGKSSIARAVRAVLWEAYRESEASEVDAWFDKSGDAWHAQLRGQECRWSKNGHEHAAPIVPPAEHARCFTISAEDLRDLASDDGQLASLILRQLSGGYDLEAVLASPLLEVGSRLGHHERRLLHRTLKDLEQTKNQHRALRERARSLDELREQLEISREARRELRDIERALELAETRDELRRVELERRALPEGLDRWVGDELERVERLGREREELSGVGRRADADLSEAQRRRDNLGLGESGVSESLIRELRARAEEVRDVDQELQSLERDRLRHSTSTETTPDDGDPADGDDVELDPIVSPDLLRDLEDFVRQRDDLRHREQTTQAELDLLDPVEANDTVDPETLGSSIPLLRRWLRTPDPRDLARPAALGAAFALVGGGVVMLTIPAQFWVAALTLVPLLPVFQAYLRDRRRPGRAAIELEYKRLSVAEPKAWTSHEVGRRLDALEKQLGAIAHADRVARLESKLSKLAREEQQLDEQRLRLHEALGVDPGGGDLGLWVIGRDLVVRAQAREALAFVTRQMDAARDRRVAVTSRLSELGERFLASDAAHPLALDSTGDEWRRAVEDLAARAAEHAKCRREIDRLEDLRERTSREQQRLDEERRTLYAQVEVEEGDRRELTRRLDALPRYRSLVEQADRITWRVDALEAELESRPALTRLGPEELREAAERCETVADRHEDLVATVTEIEREVREARAGRKLEVALAEADTARQRLSRQRDRALVASAGRFLLGDVIEDHRRHSQPRLLERAAELFAEFTRHRFRLQVGSELGDGAVGTFQAFDVAEHDVLAPSALSSGTRTQLLLAVRLAFALEGEQGPKLPFFLDEVLSHSDPERSRAVAESLRHVVEREGRQVFYLSCQPEEEALFSEVFDDGRDAEPNERPAAARRPFTVFDLARIRALTDVDEAPRVQRATKRTLPDPSLSPASYARELQVPRFDLSRGLDAQHVFHLVAPNLALVDRLLALGIDTVGQLRALLDAPYADGYLGSDADLLRTAIHIATEFDRAWSVGRGRPVERDALVEAGLSGRFLDSLSGLAEDLEGDARKLLASIDQRDDSRTKGFRQQRELTEFLRQEGYHDPRPIPSASEVHVEALARLAPLVDRGEIAADTLAARLQHLQSLTERPATSPARRRRSRTRGASR